MQPVLLYTDCCKPILNAEHTKKYHCMKTIMVKKEGNHLVFTNRNGVKMTVWRNEYLKAVWIAPLYKQWQSKRYDEKDIEIIIEN